MFPHLARTRCQFMSSSYSKELSSSFPPSPVVVQAWLFAKQLWHASFSGIPVYTDVSSACLLDSGLKFNPYFTMNNVNQNILAPQRKNDPQVITRKQKQERTKPKKHPTRTQNYIDEFILFAIKISPHFLILACM